MGLQKMWWGVGCRSKKNLMRSESRMDIEEILKMKLETIKEEPDQISHENCALIKHHTNISKKVRKIHFKIKIGKIFASQFRNKESYMLFMTGFASRGGLSGLPRY